MFVMLLALAIGAEPDYPTAYHEAINSNKPLMVLVTGDGCHYCDVLKKEQFPRIFKKIRRNRVAYTEVDVFSKWGQHYLDGGNGIPVTVIYYKEKGVWKYRKFIGSQHEAEIERTLSEAISE